MLVSGSYRLSAPFQGSPARARPRRRWAAAASGRARSPTNAPSGRTRFRRGSPRPRPDPSRLLRAASRRMVASWCIRKRSRYKRGSSGYDLPPTLTRPNAAVEPARVLGPGADRDPALVVVEARQRVVPTRDYAQPRRSRQYSASAARTRAGVRATRVSGRRRVVQNHGRSVYAWPMRSAARSRGIPAWSRLLAYSARAPALSPAVRTGALQIGPARLPAGRCPIRRIAASRARPVTARKRFACLQFDAACRRKADSGTAARRRAPSGSWDEADCSATWYNTQPQVGFAEASACAYLATAPQPRPAPISPACASLQPSGLRSVLGQFNARSLTASKERRVVVGQRSVADQQSARGRAITAGCHSPAALSIRFPAQRRRQSRRADSEDRVAFAGSDLPLLRQSPAASAVSPRRPGPRACRALSATWRNRVSATDGDQAARKSGQSGNRASAGSQT